MTKRIALCLLVGALLPAAALAAPGLPVTKPFVQPLQSWTGPPIDPQADAGQWFLDLVTQQQESRPFEFHDNVLGFGGGFASNLAIEGYAVNLQYINGPGTPLMAFNILATVTNDMPGTTPWLEGSNSHGEFTTQREPYVGEMFQTKLVTEFAISDLLNLPAGFSDPYRQGYLPYIIATNEDQLAWYCYTPGSPPQGQSTAIGNYYVPTWDFGDIPMGAFSTRVLTFQVAGGGLNPADPRYEAIVDSSQMHWDLLSNRTASLKVSNWIDNLTLDMGLPYPTDPLIGSDASVFFTPEPTVMVLLAVGAIGLRRRRA